MSSKGCGFFFRFLLVGSNTVRQTYDDRSVTVDVENVDRIAVEPGDFIGKLDVSDIAFLFVCFQFEDN